MSIYTKAISRYGKMSQVNKAIEELSELIRALSRQDLDNISEEMADVEIMFEQLYRIYNNAAYVGEWKTKKIERLYKRLEKHDNFHKNVE